MTDEIEFTYTLEEHIKRSLEFQYLSDTFDMILEFIDKHSSIGHSGNMYLTITIGNLDEIYSIIKYRHPEEFRTLESSVRIRHEENAKND